MNAFVDHLVVAAATLDEGVAWCESTLGVTPGPGGTHAFMGTHNRLLKIASPAYPQAYLEVIAIDPQAPPPARRRWFGLDEPALQARLRSEGPRLVHFVARSPMLELHREGLVAVGHQPGEPVAASRQTATGLLRWQILLREDGTLECDGALPTLLQWDGTHPADAMPDSGVSLSALALQGVPGRSLEVLRLEGVTATTPPSPATAAPLTATLATPRGEVVLRS